MDSALPNHYQPCLSVANSKHMLRKEIWKLYQIKWFFYFIILKHVHRIIPTADRFTDSWEHDRFIGDDLTLPLSPSAPLHRPYQDRRSCWIRSLSIGWAAGLWQPEASALCSGLLYCSSHRLYGPSLWGPPSLCVGLTMPVIPPTPWPCGWPNVIRWQDTSLVWVWYPSPYRSFSTHFILCFSES